MSTDGKLRFTVFKRVKQDPGRAATPRKPSGRTKSSWRFGGGGQNAKSRWWKKVPKKPDDNLPVGLKGETDTG